VVGRLMAEITPTSTTAKSIFQTVRNPSSWRRPSAQDRKAVARPVVLYASQNMIGRISKMQPILGFGDLWEDGQDVRHAVSTDLYWSQKVQREITRAVSERDFPSLASLIRLCVFLRNPLFEVRTRSYPLLSLITGIALICPFDGGFRPLFTEFLSKLPRSRKSGECRAVLMDTCERIDYAAILRDEVSSVRERALIPGFEIANLSELRICKDTYREPGRFPVQQIQILRIDSAADIRISQIIEYLEIGDWKVLVNRVDRLKNDAESWKCLSEFIQSEKMTEQVLVEIRRYVGGYWRKYHREMEVDPFVENYRTAVMRVLFSEDYN
jgi:hypothetical protein